MRKKLIIIAVVIIVLIIAVNIYRRWKRNRDMAQAQNQFNQQNTTGAGLIGYLTDQWNNLTSSDGKISENEAKAISVEIANLFEYETETATNQANALITDLYAKGWIYEGYNQVTAVSTTS